MFWINYLLILGKYMSDNQQAFVILIINMASGFGGGEFQTEQLMQMLSDEQIYFFGKSSGKFIHRVRQTMPHVRVLNIWQMLWLVLRNKRLIVHAQDGRGVHLAGLLYRLFRTPFIITRHVAFPLKRKSSLYAYQRAKMLIGVSQNITQNLTEWNENTRTIYGCIKSLQEDREFERRYFVPNQGKLRVAHIANLQEVKNFPLTIELAKNNPEIEFYLVGSGEKEQELKQLANGVGNVRFIPFTHYIGSVFKHIDLQIVPSHSEGMGAIILEGYQYGVPSMAHAVGGIPEIIENRQTGFLVQDNTVNSYQKILDELFNQPEKWQQLRQNIQDYMKNHDFSAQRMTREYREIYQGVAKKEWG